MLPFSVQTRGLRARSAWLTFLLPSLLFACSSSSGGSDDARGGTAAGGTDPGGGAGASSLAGKNSGQGGRAEGNGGSNSAGESSLAGKASGGSQAQGGSATQGGQGGGDHGETGPEEYGFTLRKPGEKNLDWLCTFQDGADSGYTYFRLLQTGTKSAGIATVPVYEVELAQLSLKGAVSTLDNAKYDYGGGHHNDSLSFDHGGKSHNYYHSSFGFGFRSCQPMDCRNVYAVGTTTLNTEGCTSARSLPEVCVSIADDGTHAALVDKFMKCPGDTQ